MTAHQQSALDVAIHAHRFAALIAGLQVGTTLTPVLQERARQEEQRLQRLVTWLNATFTRGDGLPETRRPVDQGKQKR